MLGNVYGEVMSERSGKYNARPRVLDGHHFDSTAEARRYLELKALERAGEIGYLEIHPRFTLQDAFTRDGKKYSAIAYEGDFGYMECGRQIVEDVKGVETDVFKLKRKMFLFSYPDYELRVVKA